ncbi:MAG: hypothetical protein GX062_03625 [Firmicutes bacterium]|jgi:Tfp pilus assembly protein PilV|nr:hypothetical protein [Bacillota bacterium]
MHFECKDNERGGILVDVLVAVTIVSFLLIPIINLGLISRQVAASAEQTHQAVTLAANCMEKILAEPMPLNNSHLSQPEQFGEFLRSVRVVPHDNGLLNITVDVTWGQDDATRQIELTTLLPLRPE